MIRGLSLLLLLSLLPLWGCGARPRAYHETSFAWFDTVTTLTGYETDEARFREVWETVRAELDSYHQLYDIYHAYDGIANLYTVNERVDGVHRTVKVDGRIMDLLRYGVEMYDKTDGRVNIAMGSVLSLWHAYRQRGIENPEEAALPSVSELETAAEHTDIHAMILDGETVYLSDAEMSLDVGAIAKGYAAEMVANRLESEGISGYILNLGGNVRTIGSRPDGTPFSIGVENPDRASEEPYGSVITVSNRSLVTSGSYQRYYTVTGKNYHHIIDPTTLMPAVGYRSVSVLCPSSADADVLSTALFMLPLEEGKALAEQCGAEVFWLDGNGEEYMTPNFEKMIRT
jgi:thiamine biosynthesis lipoprotein